MFHLGVLGAMSVEPTAATPKEGRLTSQGPTCPSALETCKVRRNQIAKMRSMLSSQHAGRCSVGTTTFSASATVVYHVCSREQTVVPGHINDVGAKAPRWCTRAAWDID